MDSVSFLHGICILGFDRFDSGNVLFWITNIGPQNNVKNNPKKYLHN